jgi:hypothetical protein
VGGLEPPATKPTRQPDLVLAAPRRPYRGRCISVRPAAKKSQANCPQDSGLSDSGSDFPRIPGDLLCKKGGASNKIRAAELPLPHLT